MPFRIGIDIGSKTIKIAVLGEDDELLHSLYRKHRSNIRETLIDCIHEMNWRYGEIVGPLAITGSAGIGVAEMLGVPFFQEVMATTRAVQRFVPDADAAVEIGGEDAKVIYLTGGMEQRMNASCAGGTGGFIDTISYMLGMRTDAISNCAMGAKTIYPIASRCAVFAQTDVRSLLNTGAKKADIAASTLEAVVRQVLGGLACGRPIAGKVVLLGGPFEHIPDLGRRFRRVLRNNCVKPADAHLYTVMGAALFAGSEDAPAVSLVALEERIRHCKDPDDDLERLEPLFASADELERFAERHAKHVMPKRSFYDYEGDAYLGIDAGSTTVKIALVTDAGELVYSAYEPVGGDTLKTLVEMLDDMHKSLPRLPGRKEPLIDIRYSCVTGYGEDMIKAALGVDGGVVETTAHLRAALAFDKDVSFVLDIGGQDMKAIWVKDGVITDAVLNEACSSGCGAFIGGAAHSLHTNLHRFSELALSAESPVELGTKCTVFMTSRVRHAQKIGASTADIAAGIAYSVVANALYRIIGRNRIATMGDKIIVSGGTFKSDAVLAAFEKISGVEVIRPNTAHLSGALGAALVARDRALAAVADSADATLPKTTLLGADRIASLDPARSSTVCPGCSNSCRIAMLRFGDGRFYISGNKCDRAYGALGLPQGGSRSGRAPNIVKMQQDLLARYGTQEGSGRRAGYRIGILNTLYVYDKIAFWHKLFSSLGFGIAISTEGTSQALRALSSESIPSESVCQPAKLSHERLYDLIDQGADAVFAPSFGRFTSCAVASGYAKILESNAPALEQGRVRIFTPELLASDPSDLFNDVALPDQGIANLSVAVREQFEEAVSEIVDALGAPPLEPGEFDAALDAAWDEYSACERKLVEGANLAKSWVAASPKRHGIILAGRPYHVDPMLLHGIDEILVDLGFAVVPAAGIAKWGSIRPDGAQDEWVHANRHEGIASWVLDHPDFDAVFLRSFGCGFDAVSLDIACDRLSKAHRPYAVLKIDDIVDIAHVRIRLRTLAESIESRELESESFNEKGCAEKETLPTETTRSHSAALAMEGGLGHDDLEAARSNIPSDLCFTSAVLMARTIRVAKEASAISCVKVPKICQGCLVDSLPMFVKKALGRSIEIQWCEDWPGELPSSASSSDSNDPAAPLRIGLVGNPLLVFDEYMNDHIVEKLADFGCECVMPCPERLYVDDVRYIDVLEDFRAKRVDHVIYLQSFCCLKGHVQARGALHELARLFPDLPITVIDYDPEASALSRENRVRLAIEAAHARRPQAKINPTVHRKSLSWLGWALDAVEQGSLELLRDASSCETSGKAALAYVAEDFAVANRRFGSPEDLLAALRERRSAVAESDERDERSLAVLEAAIVEMEALSK